MIIIFELYKIVLIYVCAREISDARENIWHKYTHTYTPISKSRYLSS